METHDDWKTRTKHAFNAEMIRRGVTDDRRRLINKLNSAGRLEQAALRYWVRKTGGQIVDASTTTPPPEDASHWSERTMISRGLVLRDDAPTTTPGMPVYNAANILPCRLSGKPHAIRVNIDALNTPSIWQFPHILPPRMFAVVMVITYPYASAFDPSEIAFTDTVTLFAPAPALSAFPFDLLFMSNIYAFHHILTCRMSLLNKAPHHIGPVNLRVFPWNNRLAEKAQEIESLRHDYFTAHPLYAALHVRDGEEFDPKKLLDMGIPADAAAIDDHQRIISLFQSARYNTVLDPRINALDTIIGTALGLTPEEITDVYRAMMDDALLHSADRRLPFDLAQASGALRRGSGISLE